MAAHSIRILVTLTTLVVLVVLIAAGGAGVAGAGKGNCQKVSGQVTMGTVLSGTCTSPLGMCSQGTSRGGIKGPVTFSATEYLISADTPATGVVFLTGDAVFETRGGTLMTKDAITVAMGGGGEYAEVDTIVGGTGIYAGATGSLTASGTRTEAGTAGVYTGEICVP